MRRVEEFAGEVSGIFHYPSLPSSIFLRGDAADTFAFEVEREDADKLAFGMRITVTRTTEVVIDGE